MKLTKVQIAIVAIVALFIASIAFAGQPPVGSELPTTGLDINRPAVLISIITILVAIILILAGRRIRDY
jgi:LPXTG-motif cell wall-anchored protein